MTFLTVSYAEGEPETYVVPLGIAEGDQHLIENHIVQHAKARGA